MAYRLLRSNNWWIVNKIQPIPRTHLRFSLGFGLPPATVSATVSSLLLHIFDTFVIAYAFNMETFADQPSTY